MMLKLCKIEGRMCSKWWARNFLHAAKICLFV